MWRCQEKFQKNKKNRKISRDVERKCQEGRRKLEPPSFVLHKINTKLMIKMSKLDRHWTKTFKNNSFFNLRTVHFFSFRFSILSCFYVFLFQMFLHFISFFIYFNFLHFLSFSFLIWFFPFILYFVISQHFTLHSSYLITHVIGLFSSNCRSLVLSSVISTCEWFRL